MINTTLTAGDLSAPIFVIMYRLTPDEMPHNEIVIAPIPSLTVGSDHNICSTLGGFVTFVRGRYETKQDDENLEIYEDLMRM